MQARRRTCYHAWRESCQSGGPGPRAGRIPRPPGRMTSGDRRSEGRQRGPRRHHRPRRERRSRRHHPRLQLLLPHGRRSGEGDQARVPRGRGSRPTAGCCAVSTSPRTSTRRTAASSSSATAGSCGTRASGGGTRPSRDPPGSACWTSRSEPPGRPRPATCLHDFAGGKPTGRRRLGSPSPPPPGPEIGIP